MNSLREAEERELQLHDTVTRNIKSISSTAPRDSQALITDIYVNRDIRGTLSRQPPTRLSFFCGCVIHRLHHHSCAEEASKRRRQ